MIELTLAEIAAITGGTLIDADPTVTITGPVEFDSRRLTPGGLFVAFAGEKVDGHDYAEAALAAGAVAVLGTRAVDGPTIVVEDCLTALGRLARKVLERLPDLRIVGVTGSSGKTSTKDLIAQVLARMGATVAAEGSLNNELGVPYTALRADASTRYLVLEMGARGGGHLRYLCHIAPPQVGVVVNVGVAHIGEFGSVDAIAAAKSELVTALPSDGWAVLNVDDARVRAMSALTMATVIGVGTSSDAMLRAEKITLDERGRASFTLAGPDGSVPVALALSGEHQVVNALLAAGVAVAFGAQVSDLGPVLGQCRPLSTRRMDVFDRADGVTVIDDSYNANPASMAAALQTLAAVGRGRRRVAVLGYLAELGEQERSGHEQVGRLVAELGVECLVVVGESAAAIHDGAVSQTGWGGVSVRVSDQNAAVAFLRDELRPGDVVVVKGSRYRTWEVADALRAERAQDAQRVPADRAVAR